MFLLNRLISSCWQISFFPVACSPCPQVYLPKISHFVLWYRTRKKAHFFSNITETLHMYFFFCPYLFFTNRKSTAASFSSIRHPPQTEVMKVTIGNVLLYAQKSKKEELTHFKFTKPITRQWPFCMGHQLAHAMPRPWQVKPFAHLSVSTEQGGHSQAGLLPLLTDPSSRS